MKAEYELPSEPNPQKSNAIIIRLSRAPWWLLAILGMVIALVIFIAEREIYTEAWDDIQSGIGVTIRVTLIAYSLALVLGLLIALLRSPSDSFWYNILVYQPTTFVVEVIRGIPTLVLLLYIVFGVMPALVDYLNLMGEYFIERGTNPLGLADYFATMRTRDVSFEFRAIIALAISYSAFLSEVSAQVSKVWTKDNAKPPTASA